MKSFAVKCPVPEVTAMLLSVAKRAGHDIEAPDAGGRDRDAKELGFFIKKYGPHSLSWTGTDGWMGRDCGVEYLSIEAAIAELQKPREKPIRIANHEVTFPGDGSIKVGCTVVDKATCDRIEKLRHGEGAAVRYYHSKESDLLWKFRDSGNPRVWSGRFKTWDDALNKESKCSEYPQITEAEARAKYPAAFQGAK